MTVLVFVCERINSILFRIKDLFGTLENRGLSLYPISAALSSRSGESLSACGQKTQGIILTGRYIYWLPVASATVNANKGDTRESDRSITAIMSQLGPNSSTCLSQSQTQFFFLTVFNGHTCFVKEGMLLRVRVRLKTRKVPFKSTRMSACVRARNMFAV